MSTSEATPTEDVAAEKRRKAAAAARRRRRKINLSRRQHNSPRSVSQSRVFNGPSLKEISPGKAVAERKLDENDSEDVADESTQYRAPSIASVFTFPTAAAKTTPPRIRSTVDGLCEVATRWKAQEIVALPTECTYEACISLEVCRNADDSEEQAPPDWAYRIKGLRQAANCHGTTTATSHTAAPYCWVPRTADCPLLRDCFPVRVYAMRDSEGKAQSAHRFNETLEVVQRLARHVWPGPVTLRVAVPPSEGTNGVCSSQKREFWSALTSSHALNEQQVNASQETSSMPCSYLTLRCPRHPLAVKASQKHLDTVGRRSSSFAQSQSKNEETEMSKSFSVLVGFPMAHHESPYCRSSEDVQGAFPSNAASTAPVSAVLDGENVEELFAVPTCEYGEPWNTQVWVHGPSRSITVVKKVLQGASSATTSAVATSESPSPPLLGGAVPTDLSDARIKAALRQRTASRPQLSKTKERIIQAVLCRWKISESNLV